MPGELIGIFTEKDFIKKVAAKKTWWKRIKLYEVMTIYPHSFRPENNVLDVVKKMHKGKFRHIPIVNEYNQPLYMISVKDIVSWIVSFYPREA